MKRFFLILPFLALWVLGLAQKPIKKVQQPTLQHGTREPINLPDIGVPLAPQPISGSTVIHSIPYLAKPSMGLPQGLKVKTSDVGLPTMIEGTLSTPQYPTLKTIEERTSESPNSPSITKYDDLLFFTLFSLKSGLTYDLLGLVSGFDGSNAKRNQSMGIEVLKGALSKLGVLPKREFKNVEDFKTYFESSKTLILDVTEQRTQRPQEQEEQKDNYSGKKKDIQ